MGSKAAVKGSLDKDIIRRIVRAHINEVRSCYDRGLRRYRNLGGRVEINFTIIETGHVENAVGSEPGTCCRSRAGGLCLYPCFYAASGNESQHHRSPGGYCYS